jgi:SAM-dependent methyltransferase
MRIPNKRFLLDLCFQVSTPISHGANSIHVDLGAGSIPRNPLGAEKVLATDYQSSDKYVSDVERIQCDLTRPLPFEDNTIDSFSAYDLLEHIPRWERESEEISFPFINLMNEIHRALKPGGLLIAVTPAFPSPAAFQDPTHVNIITVDTADYFCGEKAGARTLGYGFDGFFRKIQNTWMRGPSAWEQNSWLNTPSSEFLKNNSLYLDVSQIPRFIVRTFRVLRNRKPTHLLWIFQKLDQKETINWYPAP